MKNFLLLAAMVILPLLAHAQRGWVRTVSKDGKATYKECLNVSVNKDTVTFLTSKSSFLVLIHVGTDMEGDEIWQNWATQALCHKKVVKGAIVFILSEKKSAYYEVAD
jgi:hypothetical protein